jgi:hypothetical protein
MERSFWNITMRTAVIPKNGTTRRISSTIAGDGDNNGSGKKPDGTTRQLAEGEVSRMSISAAKTGRT